MTATEKLRKLLDERGVEWRKTPHYSSESQDNETIFEGSGIEWYANDHLNGRLGLRAVRYEVTPEQAVAATVGRGTCHVKAAKKMGSSFGFSLSCGHSMVNPFNDHPDYCPWCGRKVVDV